MQLALGLYSAAQRAPTRTAVACGERRFTWAEEQVRIEALAGALVRRGAGPGKRIAVLCLAGIEYFELSYAVPMTGAALVPLNTRLAAPELQHALCDCAADTLVYDGAHADIVTTLLGHVPVADFIRIGGNAESPGHAGYEDLLGERGGWNFRLWPDDHLFAIVYTGGTTGPPKGVLLSHRSIGFNVRCLVRDFEWTPDTTYLHVTPMFHLADLGPSYMLTLLGGTHVFIERFSVDGVIDLLVRWKCDAVNLVPTMIARVLDSPRLKSVDLSHVRRIGYGAAPMPESVLQKAMELLPEVSFVQFYGQTETCGAISVLRPEHLASGARDRHRLRSAGLPQFGVHLRIVDEAGNEVPRGCTGQITAMTPGAFGGYLGDEASTRAALRNGTIFTGDIGMMDADGFVYVTDRLKDMILTGGENVSSSEVEHVIAAHPDVRDVAVVGMPDRIWGERVCAVVIPRDGCTLTEEDVRDYCRPSLANYKCPKSVIIRREPLPLSAVGKVRKDLLRQQLWPEEQSR